MQHVSQSAGTYINRPQGGSNSSDNSVQSKIIDIPLNIFTLTEEETLTGFTGVSAQFSLSLIRRTWIKKREDERVKLHFFSSKFSGIWRVYLYVGIFSLISSPVQDKLSLCQHRTASFFDMNHFQTKQNTRKLNQMPPKTLRCY